MTLGAVAIVKDEAERIDALLDNLEVCDGPITLVDTGSTDDTIQRIERRGITVHHRPFVDFGTTRSEAFALARGTADWLLATDADMAWSIDGWEPDPAVDAYMIDMANGGNVSYRLPLVLRGDLAWVSRGAVHEYTLLADGSLGRREATDAIRVTMPEPSPTPPEKLAWHASLLEASLARENDPRTVFYLARTYHDLGRTKEARAMYQRRARMQGWDEETFYAAYMAAGLAPTWPERCSELLAAWSLRPSRLEPLYDLVYGLNEQGQHAAAAHLASVPIEPTSDVLFVHRGVWDWGLAAELRRAKG